MIKLRDYQERGINDIRAQFVQGKSRVCFVAPCGAGKTMLMAYMASKAAKRGMRTLFLVHRKELLEQAGKTFRDLNISFGTIAPKIKFYKDRLIQIGSIQTVVNRIGGIADPDLIILDECHHATAKSWLSVLEFFNEARVVGLTATPARLSGEGLGKIFDSLVIGPSVNELIKQKYLAPFKYYAPPVTADLIGIKTVRGDFEQRETATRMDKPTIIGDAIEHYKQLANNTKAICYCVNRSHSIHTAYMFNRADIPAVHVDATTPSTERAQAMQDFRDGKIKVLCNCDLFGEGIDVPSMQTTILLRPTKSLILFIQQSMRGMRIDKANPNKRAIILDHVGNVMRFGLPSTERNWSLEGRKKATRNKQEAQVKIMVCKKCFSVYAPAKCCPYCGAVNTVERQEIEQKQGKLKEFTEEELKQRRMEVGKAISIEELKEIAKQRGYKPAWVYIQAKLKHL